MCFLDPDFPFRSVRPYITTPHEFLEMRTKVIKLVGSNLERLSGTDQ